MQLRMWELRQLIRRCLVEIGGARTTVPRPVTRDPHSPSMADREQLGRISVKNTDDDEVAPHLQDPLYDEEECWGPVPPKGANPYAMPDPYAQDYHVIPTPQIKR